MLAATVNERPPSPEERVRFLQAKQKELESFFENLVWELANAKEINPLRTMRSKWVLKWSENDDGTPRAKARLVAQGYQDPDALNRNLETSSPTASRIGRNCVLAMAAQFEWRPWTAGVSTAFLQGKEQKRLLLVQLPLDAARLLGCPDGEKAVMKLKKPMHGH